MSRPKGSKNKKTLEREKQTLFEIVEKPPEKAMIFVTKTKNSEEDNIPIVEEKKSSIEPSKPRKVMVICDKCHKDIYCSPITINLSHLLGQASWHRDCKLERINLCTDCGRELNTLVDKWILKDNKDYYKWNVENFEKSSENS